jgi:hypothetical protein
MFHVCIYIYTYIHFVYVSLCVSVSLSVCLIVCQSHCVCVYNTVFQVIRSGTTPAAGISTDTRR